MERDTIRLARVLHSACPIGIAVACCALVSAAAPPARTPARTPPIAQASPPVPPLVLDAVVVDGKGAVVTDMKASDFQVLVDGKPRIGLAITRLYRGPGAVGLVMTRQAASPGEMPPLAEPSRVVIFVVDQGSLRAGDDRRVRLVFENCLGLVGLNDRLMLITLPDLAGSRTLSADRDLLKAGLAGIRPLRAAYVEAAGLAPPEALRPAEPAPRTDEKLPNEPVRAEAAASARPDSLAKLDDLMQGERLDSAETLSPAADKAHAASMLDSLRIMLDGLRNVPGSKTVFLLSAGLNATEADRELKAASAAAVATFTRIYAIQVPTPVLRFAEAGRVSLLHLARFTGGALVTLNDKPAQALQRMMSELSFSYLLMLSPQPEDLGPGARAVLVRTKRKDVSIHTSTTVVPNRLLPVAAAAPAAPAADGGVATVRPSAPSPAGASLAAPGGAASKRPARRDSALDAVMARVSEYADNYSHAFSAIVAEEVYEQKVTRNVSAVGALATQPTSRRLVSDYLLVKAPGEEGWMPFRDVFEVDGVMVRDRDDRLRKLFLEAPPEKAIENANKIWLESARYNIGSVWRTINVPMIPVMFVTPQFAGRFEFSKRGEPTEAGIRSWQIDYQEISRPTIIKTRTGKNLVATGTLWVDPVSGRVLRTLLRAAGATLTVTYRPHEEMTGLWLPVTMQEEYDYPSEQIRATATYAKFRRFQVITEEKIKPPKRP